MYMDKEAEIFATEYKCNFLIFATNFFCDFYNSDKKKSIIKTENSIKLNYGNNSMLISQLEQGIVASYGNNKLQLEELSIDDVNSIIITASDIANCLNFIDYSKRLQKVTKGDGCKLYNPDINKDIVLATSDKVKYSLYDRRN